jgi:hypothetical protein
VRKLRWPFIQAVTIDLSSTYGESIRWYYNAGSGLANR